jgi:hypothetical protein
MSTMMRSAAAILFCLLQLSSRAAAQVERGSWELTLAGAGQSNNDFDEHAIGLNAGVGYFPLDWLEIAIRQTLLYSKLADSSATDASTTFALDLHFPLGEQRCIVPFVGGTFGFFYGDTVTDSFEYGPEAGVKYFVNSTTFIFARVEYQFFGDELTGGSGGSSASSDDQWVYSLGIGLRF